MNIAGFIDSTLLRADATGEEIASLCGEAVDLGFAAVCVNPVRLELVVRCLADSQVIPCTVVGFPLGAVDVSLKLAEIGWALDQGAREVDMVMNIGWFKDQEYIKVAEEIRRASRLTAENGAALKVIVETALLNREELRKASIVVRDGGADFIKTSTGFSTRGASVDDLTLIRETVGDSLKIKASGGIKSRDFALKLIKVGADRLGTSSGKELLKEWYEEESGELGRDSQADQP